MVQVNVCYRVWCFLNIEILKLDQNWTKVMYFLLEMLNLLFCFDWYFICSIFVFQWFSCLWLCLLEVENDQIKDRKFPKHLEIFVILHITFDRICVRFLNDLFLHIDVKSTTSEEKRKYSRRKMTLLFSPSKEQENNTKINAWHTAWYNRVHFFIDVLFWRTL